MTLKAKLKLANLRKEDFIRIAPGQFFELLRYCRFYQENKVRTPGLYHYTNMIVLSDLYEKLFKKTEAWRYYPIAKYRVLKLRYLEYHVLAEELMHHCPNFELNDILDRIDAMFLNYYEFSLKERQKLQNLD